MIIEKVGESVEVKFKRSKLNFNHRIRGVIPVTGYTVEGLDDTYPKIFLVKLPNSEQWEICEYHTGQVLPVGDCTRHTRADSLRAALSILDDGAGELKRTALEIVEYYKEDWINN